MTGGRDADSQPPGTAADRSQRQAVNLARHLNDRYGDTVLFLARFAGGATDATHAQLLAVDETRLTLTTDVRDEPVHISFPSAGGHAEVRARIEGLLDTIRVARPNEPLTSLEQQIRGTAGGGRRSH
jgi:hypothetical protein